MVRELFMRSKIAEIAQQSGVSIPDGSRLEDMLAALPLGARRRVQLFLEGVKGQSNDPAVQQEADEFLSIASEAWKQRGT